MSFSGVGSASPMPRANFKKLDGFFIKLFRGTRVETTGGLQWSESTKCDNVFANRPKRFVPNDPRSSALVSDSRTALPRQPRSIRCRHRVLARRGSRHFSGRTAHRKALAGLRLDRYAQALMPDKDRSSSFRHVLFQDVGDAFEYPLHEQRSSRLNRAVATWGRDHRDPLSPQPPTPTRSAQEP